MPLPEWEREARDNSLVAEPSQPAPEHLPPERGACFYDALRDALLDEPDVDEEADRAAFERLRWGLAAEAADE